MANLSLVTVFIRELLAKREFPREPEPELIMVDPEQVEAYKTAGRNDGVMLASYLFHAGKISQTIKGCQTVIDLGCGPASQLAMVAELNPDISFTGVDFSETMLASAEDYIQQKKITNVQFAKGDITKLQTLADNSFDGVISTMALHHLPTNAHLELCFQEIKRIIKPRGSLYLVDFGRLKSLKSVLYFAYMNRKQQPHIFSLDYERSLRAAYLLDDFLELKNKFLPTYTIISTFIVPLLIIIKSKEHELSKNQVQWLTAQKELLAPKYQRIINDMILFFRFGGLKNNPFKKR